MCAVLWRDAYIELRANPFTVVYFRECTLTINVECHLRVIRSTQSWLLISCVRNLSK